MKKIFVFLSIILSLTSCQYKLDDYVNSAGQSFLAIEGGISDKLERQTIKLFYTSTKIDNTSIMTPVAGAKVYVLDEKGTKFNYLQTSEGLYQTADNVAGVAGSKYKLFMEIAGKLYESDYEVLPACPEIDKIYNEPTVKENLPQSSPNRGGFDVYLSFKDAPELGNYYRWTWKHYDKVDVCTTCKGKAWDDIANSCNDQNAARFAPYYIQHCRSSCFDIVYSSAVNIMADDYINGKQVDKVFITRTPYQYDGNYISGYSYFLEIEQRAINKHTYDLFKALKESQNTGSFFDVPALTKFNLNIKCTNDDSQKVIGVFEVFGTRKKPYIIDLSVNIPNATLIRIPPVAASECIPFGCTAPCIETLTRTKTAPSGWPN